MHYLEQLNSYHRSQGLSGEHLEAAVRADAALVLENVRDQGDDPDRFIKRRDEIGHLFFFRNTDQGHDYWAARDISIG